MLARNSARSQGLGQTGPTSSALHTTAVSAATPGRRHISSSDPQNTEAALSWRGHDSAQKENYDALNISLVIAATAIAVSAFGAFPALAHITLEQAEAPVSSAYKAVFRVGHGCEGSPTIKSSRSNPGGGHLGEADAEARLDRGNREGSL